MPASPQEVRLLGSALAGASPDRLARALVVIDALPDRAAADQLLEKVRPTLRDLDLPRPLSFTRLLFTPLNGLIVSPREWVPGEPGIPRSVLTIIGDLVRGSLGGSAAEIEAGCFGQNANEAAALLTLGKDLWPAAATCVPELPPSSWSETGLGRLHYNWIREQCSIVWRHSLALWPSLQAAAEGPPKDLVCRALEGPLTEGELACSVVLHLLLARAKRPASVASAALDVIPLRLGSVRTVAQKAVDRLLSEAVKRELVPKCAETEEGGITAAAAAETACALVEDFEASIFLQASGRREKIRAIRDLAEMVCRDNYRRFTSRVFAERIKQIGSASLKNVSNSIESIEGAARIMKKIERSGRRLGNAHQYDASLQSAAAEIVQVFASCTSEGLLRRSDTLRLVEILIGPDNAERLCRHVTRIEGKP
ncbi:hypothetical protein [Muricoccus aerilatus]|uniref:hypothetical protein n=1 Tax=Muricoccus aerilatus TaxID=452982 RepID=UPI0012EB5F7E|nr:hypothetical protein [Roseomonas aerilata]